MLLTEDTHIMLIKDLSQKGENSFCDRSLNVRRRLFD